jgi:Rrf2 family iron-sulfur cluster assembly transcriptional regulator
MIALTRKTTYAVEAVLEIAQTANTDPAQTRHFTESKGVGHRYLEKVMQKLVRAGVLKGVRGPGGGYVLARERRRITVGEIVRAVEATSPRVEREPEPDSVLAERVITPLWRDVRQVMMRELDGITLDDMCARASAHGLVRARPVQTGASADA